VLDIRDPGKRALRTNCIGGKVGLRCSLLPLPPVGTWKPNTMLTELLILSLHIVASVASVGKILSGLVKCSKV
jgi:hypothetical protein